MSYRITDEPTPSRWTRYVVRPEAPLLAAMLCGAWLAWPWFIANAIAMGSPTKRREIALSFGAISSTGACGLILLALMDAGVITSALAMALATIAIATTKLAAAYYVSRLQGRAFAVYEALGGTAQRGFVVIAAGIYLRPYVLGLVDDPLWRIIVSGGV